MRKSPLYAREEKYQAAPKHGFCEEIGARCADVANLGQEKKSSAIRAAAHRRGGFSNPPWGGDVATAFPRLRTIHREVETKRGGFETRPHEV
jgi:hypothetical protein